MHTPRMVCGWWVVIFFFFSPQLIVILAPTSSNRSLLLSDQAVSKAGWERAWSILGG